jgi:predicted lipid-binding transport protein (Tim44 family)
LKQLLVALFALFVGLIASIDDAEARRLGGGRSFGMSRNSSPMRQAAPTPNAAPAPTAQPGAPVRSGASRWLGPIAGLAAGIGLAALLSHFGLGDEFATLLMLALLIGGAIFLFRLLSRRNAPRPAFAGSSSLPQSPMQFAPAANVGSGNANVPAGFDSEGFLRQAKLNFLRLQAANDTGNLDDLRQFLAPEVFAEVRMQYEERGKGKQETDVAQLDAVLLELVSEGEQHIASVRFSGSIGEDGGAPAPFAEIWHLVKPVSGERGWQVAGIQQIQ